MADLQTVDKLNCTLTPRARHAVREEVGERTGFESSPALQLGRYCCIAETGDAQLPCKSHTSTPVGLGFVEMGNMHARGA